MKKLIIMMALVFGMVIASPLNVHAYNFTDKFRVTDGEFEIIVTLYMNRYEITNPICAQYDLERSTARVIRYTGLDENVTIPKTVVVSFLYKDMYNRQFHEVPVDGIASQAFVDDPLLETITIPENDVVFYFEEEAFKDCTSLKGVYFSSDKTMVLAGPKSFENCTSLTDFDMSRIGIIDDYAFSGCTSLPEFIEFGKLNYNDSKIGVGAFQNTNISGFTFNGSNVIMTISEDAFKGCKNLFYMPFFQSRSIADGAFSDCPSLRFLKFYSLEFGKNIFGETTPIEFIDCSTTGNDNARPNFYFENLSSLKKAVIFGYFEDAYPSINGDAFSGSNNLKKLYLFSDNDKPYRPTSKMELPKDITIYVAQGCASIMSRLPNWADVTNFEEIDDVAIIPCTDKIILREGKSQVYFMDIISYSDSYGVKSIDIQYDESILSVDEKTGNSWIITGLQKGKTNVNIDIKLDNGEVRTETLEVEVNEASLSGCEAVLVDSSTIDTEANVDIFTISGAKCYEGKWKTNMSDILTPGIYIVRQGNTVKKIAVK